MARDAGFVLTEETPDFGERFFLGVIKAKPVLFLLVNVIERGLQSTRKEGDVAFPMRVERLNRRGMFCAQSPLARFFFSQLFQAPGRTEGSQMTLGKNSAKPGL